MRRALPLLLALCLTAPVARAQMDSREGIALQNQLLQLRQEVEQLRRSGGIAPPAAPSVRSGGGELVGQLLDRLNALDEEVRRTRGRVDVLENQNRRLAADLEKLQGDLNFRFDQLEGRGGAARPPAAAPPAAPPPRTGAAPASTTAPTPAPAPAPRPPERAIAEGRQALDRRDFPVAEAAAREVLAARGAPQQAAAQLLLGEALLGRRDFGNAALAFDESFKRGGRGTPRGAEALLGLAASFNGLGSRREACETLNDLRSNFPNLAGAQAERAAGLRRGAGCR